MNIIIHAQLTASVFYSTLINKHGKSYFKILISLQMRLFEQNAQLF